MSLASLALHGMGSPGQGTHVAQPSAGTDLSSSHCRQTRAPRPHASTSPPGRQDPSPGPEGSAHKLLTKAASSPNGPPSMPGPHPLSLPPPLSSAGPRSTDASGIPRSRDAGTGSWLQPEACLLAEPSLRLSLLSGFLPEPPLLGAPVHSFLHLGPALHISDWPVSLSSSLGSPL